MLPKFYKLIFFLFLVSGFCGLLYQVVWIRMAYASFGITTQTLSVVVSVFMGGLALGSWIGAKIISWLKKKWGGSAIVPYAITEILIGCSAFAVPRFFSIGERYLYSVNEIYSLQYLLSAFFIITASLLPWCFLMGCTFPFMISFIKELHEDNNTNFSFLYGANILGAMIGTLVTSLALIEFFGFYHTLVFAAFLNWSVGALSFFMWTLYPAANSSPRPLLKIQEYKISWTASLKKNAFIYSVLFVTGFTSMGMEMLWIRSFTPNIGTRTYSFASLLTVYFLATSIGTFYYRKDRKAGRTITMDRLFFYLAISALFPLVINDPRFEMGVSGPLSSIFPFCALLGYLSPQLIDIYSSGNPEPAGRAYAVNILGCILGPLATAFFLLPLFGIKTSFLLLAAPYLLFLLFFIKDAIKERVFIMAAAFSVFIGTIFLSMDYEAYYRMEEGTEIRRDYAASVISTGTGMDKRLLVNGIGLTCLTDVTKIMAHLPLAYHTGHPRSALVICFGMGTTFRSILTWDIHATAVELIPSVKDAFPYYFHDAEEVFNNPKGNILIDDGRRFLNKTREKFDLITVDPPPPPQTEGASLLYSVEFYGLIKKSLKENGIFQQWIPDFGLDVTHAAARSMAMSFPYIHCFKAHGGHMLIASMQYIPPLTAEEMVAKMPEKARKDLCEFNEHLGGPADILDFARYILNKEIAMENILPQDKNIVVTDDKPYNEYYFLRNARKMIERWLR